MHKECRPGPLFFSSSALAMAAPPPGIMSLGQSMELHGVNLTCPPPREEHKRTPLIVGFTCEVFLLVGLILCFVLVLRRQRRRYHEEEEVVTAASGERVCLQSSSISSLSSNGCWVFFSGIFNFVFNGYNPPVTGKLRVFLDWKP